MKLPLAAALLGAALLSAGCGKEPDAVPPRPTATPEVAVTRDSGSRTVTDMAGRPVLLTEEVRTVAALSPSAAEFAVALGFEVVGRSTDTPESAAPGAKPIGSALAPDFHAIAALDPDLLLADAAYHSGLTRDFDRFAIPAFVLKATTYDEVLSAITALGAATGREDRAAEARDRLQAQADAAKQAARERAKAAPPRVLILTGGGRDVFAGGDQSYLGSLVALLGASNVLATAVEGGPVAGFGVVDVGQSAALAPDVVLILSSGQGGLKDQVLSTPAWSSAPAVKQSRVFELDTALFLRAPGPRAGEALQQLVPLLYP